jgi:hypothetical protein
MNGTDRPRRMGRSIGTVLAGFLAGRHSFPRHRPGTARAQGVSAWGQPMYDPGLCLLATAYRSVYAVLGSYIAARLAPHAPMGHALALGVVGLVVGGAGAIATIPMHLGPAWYPIALALTAVPCAWLGGVLYRSRRAST